MFCPGCALEVTDNLKFCKRCGASLSVVRDAMVRGSVGGASGFDCSKTRVADMLMNPDELAKERNVHPEVKRFNEIKAGVITACVGLAVTIFLAIFMEGVARANQDAAPILERLWIAGIIPLMIGLGLIINGVFVTKRMNRVLGIAAAPSPALPPRLGTPLGNRILPLPRSETETLEEVQLSPPEFSVAEPSTQRIPDSSQK